MTTALIQPGTIEQRVFSLSELRVSPDAEWPIEGYAALFNTRSSNLGGFVEEIRPGAFSRALAKPSLDVRALFNHDANQILGRSKSGTLRLAEDDIGLRIRIQPPDTTLGRDLVTSMKRGDIDQMSFSFTVAKDHWESDDQVMLRTISDVEDLYDVSIVTFPAYPDTRVHARGETLLNALRASGLYGPRINELIYRSQRGQATPEDLERINETLVILQGVLRTDSAQVGEPVVVDQPGLKAQIERLRRSLEIARHR